MEIRLGEGMPVCASVPAGISAGKYEVKKVSADEAVTQIQAIRQQLTGRELSQEELDGWLDNQQIGGNASLAVSAAAWKANLSADRLYTEWPKLFVLMFEGGEHGRDTIAMQEFTIIEDSVDSAVADYGQLRDYLETQGVQTKVEDGAEGGFSPVGFDDARVLETLKRVFPTKDIAIDAAGSFRGAGIDFEKIVSLYRVVSLEDPFSDEDWTAWGEFYRDFHDRVLVVGDDLTVTNPNRIRQALNPQVISGVVIKPNQIGTISGAVQATRTAKEAGLKTVVSHRGDETDDDWIVDFALETKADFVKLGGIYRGERIAKYNRLRELGMI